MDKFNIKLTDNDGWCSICYYDSNNEYHEEVGDIPKSIEFIKDDDNLADINDYKDMSLKEATQKIKIENKLSFKLRYIIWKKWKSDNRNNIFYQYLVLFNLVQSPTFNSAVIWHFICEDFRERRKVV